MQHKKSFLLLLLSILSVCGQCIDPIPGISVWTLAAEALHEMCTIESKVCDLESALDVDLAGTFTVFDVILAKVCDSQSISEELDSSFEELEIDLPPTISKLCVIESKVLTLEDDVQSISNSTNDDIFTALDGLQTTLCSKIEQVSSELMQVQNTITNITQSEIDNTATILSKLDVLDDQVDDLNSALDALSIDTDVNNLDSCIDILVSLADNLLVDVCDLESAVEVGFDGTFTALDAQLIKACDLVSLADVMDPTVMVDFMGVFTSLDELHETVCTIESLVDIVCLINTEQLLCTAGSKIDLALAKICTAESVIEPLASIADDVTSILEAVDEQAIMDVCSNIEEAISKLGPIETKIDEINSKVDTWQIDQNYSKLEQIEQTLLTVCSKLDQFDVTDSKLCVIDSKLDEANQEALTIESVVDEINLQADVIDSKIDDFLPIAFTVESKICNILDDTVTICSNLDGLNTVLEEIDSKLDVILPAMQSNVDGLISIESKVEIIDSRICAIDIDPLNSKLDNIESLVCNVEDNMAIANSLIDDANNKAIGLEDDFASTWTILDTIEQKLCTSESVLETVSSKLDDVDLSVDLSGVFTVIDTILLKECTIDSKTDVAISLVDILIGNQGDLSGTFTALDALLMKVCTIDSQTDVLDSKVDRLITFCGTPIYNSDLPLTISTSGRYFVAESLVYSPAGTGTSAITISASNVTLDLNGYDLSQTSGQSGIANTQGIVVSSSLNNIRIENGSVHDLTSKGVSINSGCSHILVRGVSVLRVGTTGGSGFAGDNGIDSDTGCSNIIIDNCQTFCTADVGIFLVGSSASPITNSIIRNSTAGAVPTSSAMGIQSPQNCIVTKCRGTNVTDRGAFLQDFGASFTANSIIEKSIFNDSRGGTLLSGVGGCVIQDCFMTTHTQSNVLFLFDASENIVINNTCNNGFDGISLVSVTGPQTNNYVSFNSILGAERFGVEEVSSLGPNTYLGNFVGNSGTANFDVQGASNIGSKFTTLAQTTVFDATTQEPTKWSNINMLP